MRCVMLQLNTDIFLAQLLEDELFHELIIAYFVDKIVAFSTIIVWIKSSRATATLPPCGLFLSLRC